MTPITVNFTCDDALLSKIYDDVISPTQKSKKAESIVVVVLASAGLAAIFHFGVFGDPGDGLIFKGALALLAACGMYHFFFHKKRWIKSQRKDRLHNKPLCVEFNAENIVVKTPDFAVTHNWLGQSLDEKLQGLLISSDGVTTVYAPKSCFASADDIRKIEEMFDRAKAPSFCPPPVPDQQHRA